MINLQFTYIIIVIRGKFEIDRAIQIHNAEKLKITLMSSLETP